MVMATQPEARSSTEFGWLALPEQRLPNFQLMALKIRRDAGHVGGAAEFLGEPALEAMRRGFADLVIHEEHVLAPLDRLVARGKDLMRLAAGEEARLLEASAHHLAEAGKDEGDVVLIAIIAELDEA